MRRPTSPIAWAGASPMTRAKSSSMSQRTLSTSQLISAASCTSPSMRTAGLSPSTAAWASVNGDSSVTVSIRSGLAVMGAMSSSPAGVASTLIVKDRHCACTTRPFWRASLACASCSCISTWLMNSTRRCCTSSTTQAGGCKLALILSTRPSRKGKGDGVAIVPRLFLKKRRRDGQGPNSGTRGTGFAAPLRWLRNRLRWQACPHPNLPPAGEGENQVARSADPFGNAWNRLRRSAALPPMGGGGRQAASGGVSYCNACTPATSHPTLPVLGLVMFQTSRNGLGPAEGSSRIMPENSTLAM